MKRIIGVSLVLLLAFAAIGGLRPSESEAFNEEFIDAITRYFDGEISKTQLDAILNAQDPPITVVSTNQSERIITTTAPRDSGWVNPNPPADLTPWAMIEQYAASMNPTNYCDPTLTVIVPLNIRTYGGIRYTVRNLNYNKPYCVALLEWERNRDLWQGEGEAPPPRPTPPPSP